MGAWRFFLRSLAGVSSSANWGCDGEVRLCVGALVRIGERPACSGGLREFASCREKVEDRGTGREVPR